MEELRVGIIDLCNKSGLPLEALLFVTRDVYRDVDIAYQNYKARAAIAKDTQPAPVEEKQEEN